MLYRKYGVVVGAWLAFLVMMVFLVDHHRTVSITLWQAGHHWLLGQPLYGNDGRGFIYLPQSAIFCIPFAVLPFAVSEALWRVLSLSIFAAGLFSFIVNLVEPSDRSAVSTHQCFFLASALSFLLAFDSARNGQIHLLITGLLMFAAVKLSQQKWFTATLLAVLAVFLKPTAVVFLLLTLGVFFSETLFYFLICCSLFLLFPLLTQSWHYVWGQYLASVNMLMRAANTGQPQEWAQIFNLVSQVGWNMPPLLQNLIRIIFAVVTLRWVLWIKQRQGLRQAAIWLLMLAMNYLMLFNPRTENNDYMMLIPGLSYCLIGTLLEKKFYRTAFLTLIILGLVGSYYISNLFVGHHNWAAPLMGLLSLLYLIWLSNSGIRSEPLKAAMDIVKS